LLCFCFWLYFKFVTRIRVVCLKWCKWIEDNNTAKILLNIHFPHVISNLSNPERYENIHEYIKYTVYKIHNIQNTIHKIQKNTLVLNLPYKYTSFRPLFSIFVEECNILQNIYQGNCMTYTLVPRGSYQCHNIHSLYCSPNIAVTHTQDYGIKSLSLSLSFSFLTQLPLNISQDEGKSDVNLVMFDATSKPWSKQMYTQLFLLFLPIPIFLYFVFCFVFVFVLCFVFGFFVFVLFVLGWKLLLSSRHTLQALRWLWMHLIGDSYQTSPPLASSLLSSSFPPPFLLLSSSFPPPFLLLSSSSLLSSHLPHSSLISFTSFHSSSPPSLSLFPLLFFYARLLSFIDLIFL
jgi:hypothetical protein